MDNPRVPFERLLDVFNDSFRAIGEREGLVFDHREGHVERALRLESGQLEKGVFLNLKSHWMKSDPNDPDVVLAYGARSSTHVLGKNFFEGKRSALIQCIDERLIVAISELKSVSEELVARSGRSLEDFKRGLVDL